MEGVRVGGFAFLLLLVLFEVSFLGFLVGWLGFGGFCLVSSFYLIGLKRI